MRNRNHLGTLFILTLLASMAAISLPSTSAQSTVTFRVEPNVTSGVPVGGQVAVDVYIDAPTGSAIVGWAFDVQVDPAVLEVGYRPNPFVDPIWAQGGIGYFLATWCKWYKWEQGTDFNEGVRNVPAGTIEGMVESVVAWMDLEQGTGASGSAKRLVSLFFTSKSETAYSPIEITNAYYFTSWNSPDLDKQPANVISGHYNEPLRVDLVKKSAFPEHQGAFYLSGDEDGIVNLYAVVKNVGPAATYCKVEFELTTATGVPKYYEYTPDHYLAPGEMHGFKASDRYYAQWTTPELGIWYVAARAYFDADGDLGTDDWTLSPDNPKTFKFQVKP